MDGPFQERIAALQRALSDDLQDLGAWVELCQLAERMDVAPATLAPPVPKAVQAKLWARALADRGQISCVLPLFGLKLAVGKADSPGRFWTATGRLGEASDHWYDKESGFPLRVERLVDGAPMGFVPAGPFEAFAVESGYEARDSRAQTMPSYYVDLYPVTVARYARFLEAVAIPPPDHWEPQRARPRRPVVWVTWHAAMRYADWVGGRLLGDLGWQKAARGPGAEEFPPGSEGRLRADVRARAARAAALDLWDELLVEVGLAPEAATPYGIHDMCGLVREWCVDEIDGYGSSSLDPAHRVRGSSALEPSADRPYQPGGRLGGDGAGDLGFRVGRPGWEPVYSGRRRVGRI